MSIFVGLQLSEEDLDMMDRWFKACASSGDFPLQRPIHRSRIHIPLAYSNSNRMDHYEPVNFDEVIYFGQPHVRWLGDRGTVVLEFQNDWLMERMEQMITLGFKRRHKKLKCRIPMSIHSSFLDFTWISLLKKRSVRVVGEIVMPFDNGFGKYAHLPKEDFHEPA